MAAERLRLSRAAGSRLPAGAIRVDRATIYGNPWRPGRPGALIVPAETDAPVSLELIPFDGPMSAVEAVAAYRRWLSEGALLLPQQAHPISLDRATRALRIRRVLILDRLHQLHGRQLACWCAIGAPCHADVLIAIATERRP